MKAIELTAPALTAFHQTELPDPKAGRGEVLVRLRAATLNFLDVAIVTGSFPGTGFPMIPVADGAGEVAALGEGVNGLAIGDRVIPHFMPNWQGGVITPRNIAAMRGVTLPGSLAEYVAVPATSLVTLPSHLDFALLPIVSCRLSIVFLASATPAQPMPNSVTASGTLANSPSRIEPW